MMNILTCPCDEPQSNNSCIKSIIGRTVVIVGVAGPNGIIFPSSAYLNKVYPRNIRRGGGEMTLSARTECRHTKVCTQRAAILCIALLLTKGQKSERHREMNWAFVHISCADSSHAQGGR